MARLRGGKGSCRTASFLEPGEATAGIRNLNLLYNGQYADGLGDWNKERIIPNISYVNKDGEPVDWLLTGSYISDWLRLPAVTSVSDKRYWRIGTGIWIKPSQPLGICNS